MEFVSFDGAEGGENNSVGFVEISKMFAMWGAFFWNNISRQSTVYKNMDCATMIYLVNRTRKKTTTKLDGK